MATSPQPAQGTNVPRRLQSGPRRHQTRFGPTSQQLPGDLTSSLLGKVAAESCQFPACSRNISGSSAAYECLKCNGFFCSEHSNPFDHSCSSSGISECKLAFFARVKLAFWALILHILFSECILLSADIFPITQINNTIMHACGVLSASVLSFLVASWWHRSRLARRPWGAVLLPHRKGGSMKRKRVTYYPYRCLTVFQVYSWLWMLHIIASAEAILAQSKVRLITSTLTAYFASALGLAILYVEGRIEAGREGIVVRWLLHEYRWAVGWCMSVTRPSCYKRLRCFTEKVNLPAVLYTLREISEMSFLFVTRDNSRLLVEGMNGFHEIQASGGEDSVFVHVSDEISEVERGELRRVSVQDDSLVGCRERVDVELRKKVIALADPGQRWSYRKLGRVVHVVNYDHTGLEVARVRSALAELNVPILSNLLKAGLGYARIPRIHNLSEEVDRIDQADRERFIATIFAKSRLAGIRLRSYEECVCYTYDQDTKGPFINVGAQTGEPEGPRCSSKLDETGICRRP